MDNWGIKAMAIVVLVVLPCLSNNSPAGLKYGLELMGFLSSHPPPGDSGEAGGVIR